MPWIYSSGSSITRHRKEQGHSVRVSVLQWLLMMIAHHDCPRVNDQTRSFSRVTQRMFSWACLLCCWWMIPLLLFTSFLPDDDGVGVVWTNWERWGMRLVVFMRVYRFLFNNQTAISSSDCVLLLLLIVQCEWLGTLLFLAQWESPWKLFCNAANNIYCLRFRLSDSLTSGDPFCMPLLPRSCFCRCGE